MSRQLLIEKATAELGTTENPAGSNKNKYGVWYGMNGQPWCAMFVSWVYEQAGHPLGTIDSARGYASCQSGFNHWKASGELTQAPQPGDIVLYDWNGDNHCDHTGIFESWIIQGESFNAIEGNTATGNDSNGGKVMRRQRKAASVKAFVSPKVLNGAAATIPFDLTLHRGSKGSDVASLQKQLFDIGFDIVVDGDFGPKTEDIIKQYQQNHGLQVTGIATHELQEFIANNNVSSSQLITGSFLHKGNSGAAVAALQNALIQKGSLLKADGVFGDNTFNALKAFQANAGLLADGIAGPKTFAALALNEV